MNFQQELETLIRARYPILYIVTSEETRVQNLIVPIGTKRQKKVFEWSYSTGLLPAGNSFIQGFPSVPNEKQPRRDPQTQGYRPASEEQLQDGHPDFANFGNPQR